MILVFYFRAQIAISAKKMNNIYPPTRLSVLLFFKKFRKMTTDDATFIDSKKWEIFRPLFVPSS